VAICRAPELISIYAHRQAVPIIEDDDCLMKRFVRWERIEQWMDAALDRELYLVVSPPDPGSKDCWDRQAAALLEHPPMQLDVVRSSPDVLVARVMRRTDPRSSRWARGGN